MPSRFLALYRERCRHARAPFPEPQSVRGAAGREPARSHPARGLIGPGIRAAACGARKFKRGHENMPQATADGAQMTT